jgi:hypothetical protein
LRSAIRQQAPQAVNSVLFFESMLGHCKASRQFSLQPLGWHQNYSFDLFFWPRFENSAVAETNSARNFSRFNGI